MTSTAVRPATTPRLIVSWNLRLLAANLAAHLESLSRSDKSARDTYMQSKDYLEPYALSPDDEHTVITWAWGKECIDLLQLVAGLAAHLEALRRADDLESTGTRSEEYLKPYNLSREDEHWVTMVAWGKQCVDCGDVEDYYMVYDRLWKKARLKPNQCCCTQCLEVRLGRPLEPGEFTAIVSLAWSRRQHPQSATPRALSLEPITAANGKERGGETG